MRERNQEIRQAIRKARIYQYDVADKLGISENTFIRWLRKELPQDKKALILQAIEELKKEA